MRKAAAAGVGPDLLQTTYSTRAGASVTSTVTTPVSWGAKADVNRAMPRPCPTSRVRKSALVTSKATSRSRPAAAKASSDWARPAVPAGRSTKVMLYGAGGAVGNFIAGYTAKKNPRATFVTACLGLVASLLSLLTIGHSLIGTIILLVVWGGSFGAWQLSQLTMTLNAAPDTFEAAMSLNTLAYTTSIALGALFGGLFADGLGVRSALWYGAALTAASLLVILATRRATSR